MAAVVCCLSLVLPAQASEAMSKAGAAAQADDTLRADNPHEPEPDIAQARATEYACDLNDKVTIYEFDGQADRIALRWRNRLHRMTRVVSVSGAQRFEDQNWRLTWIGIPAKGILLDSRARRQLANECMSTAQREAAARAATQPQGGHSGLLGSSTH
jgi:membrane-bound inhibitor of C-type lysozyme